MSVYDLLNLSLQTAMGTEDVGPIWLHHTNICRFYRTWECQWNIYKRWKVGHAFLSFFSFVLYYK